MVTSNESGLILGAEVRGRKLGEYVTQIQYHRRGMVFTPAGAGIIGSTVNFADLMFFNAGGGALRSNCAEGGLSYDFRVIELGVSLHPVNLVLGAEDSSVPALVLVHNLQSILQEHMGRVFEMIFGGSVGTLVVDQKTYLQFPIRIMADPVNVGAAEMRLQPGFVLPVSIDIPRNKPFSLQIACPEAAVNASLADLIETLVPLCDPYLPAGWTYPLTAGGLTGTMDVTVYALGTAAREQR